MARWWIGCSGFHYANWRGAFYPEKLAQRKWFEYYCEHFNTVELNVTHYRFPRVKDLKTWYERSPAEFRFSVKMHRMITHYRKFRDVARPLNDFYSLVQEGLGDKLGCVLFQLHPNMVYSEESLDRIVQSLDAGFQNIVEFRHESWWNAKVRKTLRDNNIGFCGISYPGLPDNVVRTSPTVYYRFHGVPKLYLSSYKNEKLGEVATALGRLRNVEDIYCYFNNDIEVAAVANAKTLRELVDRPQHRLKRKIVA